MKANKVIAGVSALVMAAANVCAVSAQAIEEEVITNTTGSEETVVTPVEDEEIDEFFTEAAGDKGNRPDFQRPGNGENCEKPEITDEEKPELPEKPEITDEEKPELPERPEITDEEKPERPEKPEITDEEKPEHNGENRPEQGKNNFSEEIINLVKDFINSLEAIIPDFSGFEEFEFSDDFGMKEFMEVCRDFRNKAKESGKENFAEYKGAFKDFTGLKKFEVNENNEEFTAEDGVLFDKDKKTLLSYPDNKEGEEFVIPEGVEEIAPHAFDNCKNLKKVTLPESVKKIGKGAFENCENLEEVTLPEDIKVIEEDTFKDDVNLKKMNKPEKLEVIKDKAFENCEKLDEEAAETVRKHAGRKYGDINQDDYVDLSDLSELALSVIGEKEFDEDQKVSADVLDDEKIDIIDITTLKKHIITRKGNLGPAPAADIFAEDAE